MSHAGWETRLLLRNGEQLLLTFAIPVGLLLVLTVTNLFSASSGPDRIPRALATVLAVSVLSAAFTSLAIATGFEVLLLGTAACAAWGMALAGLLRAEAVLAVANGIFLVLILFGGVIIPADSLPGPLAALVPYLPSGALVEGFSAPLVAGQAPGAAPIVVLASWLTVGTLLSGRTFRWS